MASKVINTVLNLKDNFSGSLKKATANTKEFKRQTREAKATLNDFKKGAKTVFLAVGAAATAGAASMVAITKDALDYADGLQKAADVSGFTVERIQELQYVGENLGVAWETMQGANSKLIKSMDAAKSKKSAQAKAFKTLGISVYGANGKLKDSKKIFTQALERLGKVKNETQRNALAMKIFGKSAMELNPLIKAGGKEINRMTKELQASGAILSGEQVAALDNFGDSIGSLKLMFRGIGADIAVQFMPILQEAIDTAKKTDFKTLAKKAKDAVSGGLTLLGGGIRFVKDNMEWLLPVVGGTVAAIASFKVITGAIALFKALKTVLIATTVAEGGLNVVMRANPIGLVVTAIGLAVAAGIALYRNWDKVKAGAQALWTAMDNNPIGRFVKGYIKSLIDNVKMVFDVFMKVVGAIKDAWDWLTKWNGTDPKSKTLTVEEQRLQNGGYNIGGGKPNTGRPFGKALGTPYWKGGPTPVNERGGEIIDLPSGSRVIPADKSAKMLGGRPIQVIVNIAGNVLGDEAYARKLGGIIAKDISFALAKG